MVFHLNNSYDMECFDYSLVQLNGVAPLCNCEKLMVECFSNERRTHFMSWPLCAHLFKILAPLRVGLNTIRLSCLHESVDCRMLYNQPAPLIPYVRAIYVICENEDKVNQLYDDAEDSLITACRRVGFALRILQTVFAETMFAEGRGKLTFACAGDFGDNEKLKPMTIATPTSAACWNVRLSTPNDLLFNLTADKVWEKIAIELRKVFPQDINEGKWLTVFGSTYYHALSDFDSLPESHDEIVNRTKGYYNLGAGGLALLSSGTLYAWPRDLDEFLRCVTDTRMVDKRKLMDDSAFRGTYCANYATGLGAALHELGHCFDLDHCQKGIMHRGGDDINLILGFPLSSAKLTSPSLAPRLPYPMPGILQFAAVSFYEYAKYYNPLLSEEPKVKIWGECDSLYQHGQAFWGLEISAFLANHRWLRRLPSEKRLSEDVFTFNGSVFRSKFGFRVVQARLSEDTLLKDLRSVGLWRNKYCLLMRDNLSHLPEGQIIFHLDWKIKQEAICLHELLSDLMKARVTSMRLVALDIRGNTYRETLQVEILSKKDNQHLVCNRIWKPIAHK